ncbi:MAG TPA: FAD-dependent oxidoreductase [Solirubrobacteraceae bacterium]|jgi:3-phenylpropionate/trans-cinnamate dioxygenase ferredoxin reductase subunit
MSTFVIVGAGLAGASAATALREEGFEGRVVLVGAEPEAPYERPPLSKEVLRGEAPPESALVHDDAGFYSEHGIELLTDTTVTAIDRTAAEVELHGGERLRYDRLLLATGASPRRLPRARALRTLADARALGESLVEGRRAVIVGAGWIGCEVAASARARGVHVTVVEPASVPLERVLGPELGAFYADVHREHDVELLLGHGVESIEADGDVKRVLLTDGSVREADVVVAGIGVTPNVDLAAEAGLEIDGGIAVDSRLTTADPRILAAGDVAAAEHPVFGGRVRVEHWANAKNQGAAAGRAMLGSPEPYERIPYFYSDQYDVGMEYSGWAPVWDEVVIEGDVEAREFLAFWLRDGRVVAGMNVNVWDVAERVQEVVRAGGTVADATAAVR